MRMTYLGRRALSWAVAVGLCLLAAAPVAAQTTSASVSGQVKDAQGGVLPGAAVALTSKTQANTLTATTDAEGRFVFPIVRPDEYVLRVTMQGFKTLERTTVQVSANDRFFTGILTLDVGAITEEVSVTGRVSELQATSGERSFTMESEVIKNIASNGRALFHFATLVPGVVSQNTSGNVEGQVSAFTVNGQRPNSNNMTIDGVANIDTGDNGGNMATTNIDAVAEFKILTNAYQAEYGRAVGGQVQVVTKSGTQAFHGSGYWYGRRSDWNANTWTNKRAEAPAPVGNGKLIELPESSRNDYGYTLGGPIYIPGVFNQEKKKLFFFWSQEFQKRKDPVSNRDHRVPTALERRGDFSQSLDSSGNPYPYIRDYTTGLPCSASDTTWLLPGRRRHRPDPPEPPLCEPGITALNIFPLPNFSAGSGVNYTSQEPSDRPRREDLIRLDFQPSDKWRFTGRYMNTKDNEVQAYGTTWAGSGSDQLPMPVLHPIPGRNWMLSIDRHPQHHHVGRGERRGRAQLAQLRAAGREPVPPGGGAHRLPVPLPGRPPGRLPSPDFQFRGGRTGNAGQYQTNQGPFVNENKTYDAIANLTKIWGNHAAKFGVYYQHSYKAQSNFASFNSTINFVDNSSNPYDTGYSYANAATGVFNTYKQANKFAYPEYVYKNFEWYVQDNWKVNSRLTRRLRRPLLLHDAAVGPDAPGVHLPARRVERRRRPAAVLPACKNGASPCSGSNLIGVDPANPANTVEGRFVGRLVHRHRRHGSTAPSRPARASTTRCTAGTSSRSRPGSASSTTSRARAARSSAAASGSSTTGRRATSCSTRSTTLRACCSRRVQWGLLQNLTGGANDPYPALGDAADGVRLHPAEGDGLERRRAAQAVARHHPGHRLRRVQERRTSSSRSRSTHCPWGRSSSRRTRTRPGRRAPRRAPRP